MNEPTPSIPLAAIAALENGNKIEAIKIVRVTLNLGLKDSKDIVDAYVLNRPELKERLDAKSTLSIEAGMRWLFVVSAICLVAYYFVFVLNS